MSATSWVPQFSRNILMPNALRSWLSLSLLHTCLKGWQLPTGLKVTSRFCQLGRGGAWATHHFGVGVFWVSVSALDLGEWMFSHQDQQPGLGCFVSGALSLDKRRSARGSQRLREMPHSSACPKLRWRRSVEPRFILCSKEVGTDRLDRTSQMRHLMHFWREQLVQYPSSHIQSSFRSSKWPAEPCRPKDGSKDSAGDCTRVVEKAGLSCPLKFWTRWGDGEVNQRRRCKEEEILQTPSAFEQKVGKRPVKEQG